MKSVKVYVDKYVKQNKIKEIRRNIAKIVYAFSKMSFIMKSVKFYFENVEMFV